MNTIFGRIKDLVYTSGRLLNQPVVKEGVKNISGLITFNLDWSKLMTFINLSVFQSISQGVNWIYKAIQHHQSSPVKTLQTHLKETKVRFMILFNIITSRPVLHIGNRFR